jgi:hypothetical protein
MHFINRVIHSVDQVADVPAIERGDEGAANRQMYLAGNLVRLLLTLPDLLAISCSLAPILEEAIKSLCAGDD